MAQEKLPKPIKHTTCTVNFACRTFCHVRCSTTSYHFCVQSGAMCGQYLSFKHILETQDNKK